jgi:hypothetical protein
MRPTSRSVWLGAAALTLSAVLAPPIRALTFSSSCDRFAIDGNGGRRLLKKILTRWGTSASTSSPD